DLDAGGRGGDGPERAANLLGGVGLQVPEVNVAGAAVHVQEDARLRPRPWRRGSRDRGRQGPRAESHRPEGQEIAPPHSHSPGPIPSRMMLPSQTWWAVFVKTAHPTRS